MVKFKTTSLTAILGSSNDSIFLLSQYSSHISSEFCSQVLVPHQIRYKILRSDLKIALISGAIKDKQVLPKSDNKTTCSYFLPNSVCCGDLVSYGVLVLVVKLPGVICPDRPCECSPFSAVDFFSLLFWPLWVICFDILCWMLECFGDLVSLMVCCCCWWWSSLG